MISTTQLRILRTFSHTSHTSHTSIPSRLVRRPNAPTRRTQQARPSPRAPQRPFSTSNPSRQEPHDEPQGRDVHIPGSPPTHPVSPAAANPPATTRPPPLDLPARRPETGTLSHLLATGKAYLTFYKTGLRHIYTNTRLVWSLDTAARAAGTGTGTGTTRSAELLRRRWAHDVRRLPVFALLLLVCGEFTPLVVLAVPGVVPLTCRIPQQVGRLRRRAEERRAASFDALGRKYGRGPFLGGEEGVVERKEGAIGQRTDEDGAATAATASTTTVPGGPAGGEASAQGGSRTAPAAAAERRAQDNDDNNTRDNHDTTPSTVQQGLYAGLSPADVTAHLARSLGLISPLWDRAPLSLLPDTVVSAVASRRVRRHLAYLDRDNHLLAQAGGAGALGDEEVLLASEDRGVWPATVVVEGGDGGGGGGGVVTPLVARENLRRWLYLVGDDDRVGDPWSDERAAEREARMVVLMTRRHWPRRRSTVRASARALQGKVQ